MCGNNNTGFQIQTVWMSSFYHLAQQALQTYPTEFELFMVTFEKSTLPQQNTGRKQLGKSKKPSTMASCDMRWH